MSREVLPNNVTPLHYDITLEPNFRAFTFEGSLKIDLQINDHSINSVQINYLEIDFHSARIEGVMPLKLTKTKTNKKLLLSFLMELLKT